MHKDNRAPSQSWFVHQLPPLSHCNPPLEPLVGQLSPEQSLVAQRVWPFQQNGFKAWLHFYPEQQQVHAQDQYGDQRYICHDYKLQ